jgi:hypothetical protein
MQETVQIRLSSCVFCVLGIVLQYFLKIILFDNINIFISIYIEAFFNVKFIFKMHLKVEAFTP